jgi:iron-sulfur cluster repair protein YtfE (RIC family)
MAISLGARPEHGFDEPLGLLSDCHRRIERFLDTLLRVVAECPGGELAPRARQGLEVALRYFKEAAPRHTADEEASLFPRVRAVADPRARAAMAAIDKLEAQHDAADALHAEVDHIGRHWLADGRLGADDLGRLHDALTELRAIYEEHIAAEDHGIFPLAAQILDPATLAEVGREMAARRGLAHPTPSPREIPR